MDDILMVVTAALFILLESWLLIEDIYREGKGLEF